METRRPDWPALSPMFHYYVTRFVNAGADAGGALFLDSGLHTLVAQGICRETDHRSVFSDPGMRAYPKPSAFTDARARRLAGQPLSRPWQRVSVISRSRDVRRHIRLGRPVVAAFTLPLTYPHSFLNAHSEWLHPSTPPPSASRHCVLLVGFDDARRCVRVFDSQGEAAFDRGMWWMGYAVLDSDAVFDAYALL